MKLDFFLPNPFEIQENPVQFPQQHRLEVASKLKWLSILSDVGHVVIDNEFEKCVFFFFETKNDE